MSPIPNPAIVAQSVTRRLPRRVLLIFCLAYILPGFIGREPWKNADITAFGYMLELVGGNTSWLAPQLLGQAPEISGLLPYWLGAWAMQMAPSWVAPDFAARLPFMVLLGMTLLATWHGVYYLARSPSALPVVFAFGGEAKPKDYARTIADGGLLALIASLGLAQFSHETTPAMAQLCCTVIIFYTVAAMPYHALSSRGIFFLGLLGLSLSGAPSMAMALGLGSLVIFAYDQLVGSKKRDADDRARDWRSSLWMGASLLCAAVLVTALDVWRWTITMPEGSWNELQGISRLLLWFAWPTWPLGLWTLWRWRRQYASRHVALPLWFASVAFFSMVFTHTSDRALLLGLPALATLAAFALPTLERRLSALIDWFTLFFFTAIGLLIWAVWIAMQTGSPPRSVLFVERLVPGYIPSFSLIPFSIALLGTLAWVWLVSWRVGRHRTAMWKSMVLPAGGTALCWLLLMTLWLPILDFARSYAPLVSRVTDMVGKTTCVQVYGLSAGQITAFKYHGGLEVLPAATDTSLAPEQKCPWLIVDADAEVALAINVKMQPWKFVTKVRRPSDDNEDVLLYRRATN
ncbi:MAG: hypothetical protein Q7K57_59230 [Burkholderiaceae bacterium]|nr:hypothetical protein [Burkholderiaceae bacterium]